MSVSAGKPTPTDEAAFFVGADFPTLKCWIGIAVVKKNLSVQRPECRRSRGPGIPSKTLYGPPVAHKPKILVFLPVEAMVASIRAARAGSLALSADTGLAACNTSFFAGAYGCHRSGWAFNAKPFNADSISSIFSLLSLNGRRDNGCACGSHNVELRFQLPGQHMGLWLGLLGVLAMVGLLLYGHKHKTRL